MHHPLLLRLGLAMVALSGCAAQTESRPEPETPQLTIEDRSYMAPPPAPPAAPPADAEATPSPVSSAASAAAPAPPPARPAAAMSTAPPSAPPDYPGTPQAPSAPPSAPPGYPSAPQPPSAPYEPAPPAAATDSAHWAYEYPTGRWVYANGYGWMWVPANATSVDNDGVPYAYLYTPSYGWTWYLSPWGPGAYRYGVWVRHPYRPVGWHGAWIAQPRVVVRLGGPGRHYHHRHGR